MRKSQTNRPHWHVLARHGAGWFMAGVRMNEGERKEELRLGRRRVVRRWFTSSAAAGKLKKRLNEQGKDAMTFQCPPPEDAFCTDGPP